MKALILSGGHGTRLRPITHSQQKQLIPVANKPILFHPIEDVIEAGAQEIGIITGPNRDQVVDTVSSVEWDADIEFIYQGEPKGVSHTHTRGGGISLPMKISSCTSGITSSKAALRSMRRGSGSSGQRRWCFSPRSTIRSASASPTSTRQEG